MPFRPNILQIALAGLVLILMGWMISTAPVAGNEICDCISIDTTSPLTP